MIAHSRSDKNGKGGGMALYEDRIFPLLLTLGTRGFRRNRRALAERASGQVLEIGAGNGENFPHYRVGKVERLVALEPNEAMLADAVKRHRKLGAPWPLEPVVGSAHDLPFADNHFDCVVLCLVLCTIPSPGRALEEARRVLKPGGRLLVFEHVLSRSPRRARWQRRINPAWQVLACGCHLDRDSEANIRAAGFEWRQLERYRHRRAPSLVSSVIEGEAVKPGKA